MMINKYIFPLIALTSFGANSATIDITFGSFTAEWQNVVTSDGGNTTTESGTATDPMISWGGSAGYGQSGYTFESEDTFVTTFDSATEQSDVFNLGTFTHANNPVYPPSLDNAQLKLTTTVSLGGAASSPIEFVFDFNHEETPNNDTPCAYPETVQQPDVNDNGCADRVLVSSAAATQTFLIDSVQYTIAVEGFKVSGNTISSFLTKEVADNEAIITAKVMSYERAMIPPTQIPEPAPLAFLGASFLFFARKLSVHNS
ncbi:THxN family PEP-CTERM protein [Photobacterium minamisatsumaniensis]|uniref:THxN family PEP-CTERM protein n=1 Tax=Photobacterium minamisatsumaniensis TaxID=2910233 RepID=UPI003D13194F